MTKTVAVLGSSGSIGRQTLQVVQELGLTVAALTANRQVDLLEDGTVCEVNSNAHLVNLKKCTGIDTAPLLFRAIQEALQ